MSSTIKKGYVMMRIKWIPTSSKTKELFWYVVFKILFLFSRMFFSRKGGTHKNIQETVSENSLQETASKKSEPSLGILIKQIITLEKKLRAINEHDPLITYGVTREDERVWIEARRIRIQTYSISIPFDETNLTHMKEAAEGYLLALQNRLDVLEGK